MKTLNSGIASLALAAMGVLAACSSTPRSPDVAANVRNSIKSESLKDVSVSQDREKDVVTLTGKVRSEADKAQAESLAKSIAAGQVVADEIAVIPPGTDSEARKINSDLDKGIENNLHAALVSQRLDYGVKCSVKNKVVTLPGNVDSEDSRARAQSVAVGVPYVAQVVNELQVTGQKATSSN